MAEDYYIVPLYHRVKESIFFSFEECVQARTEFFNFPSTPNQKNFKNRVLNFYNRIRPKIVRTIQEKKMKQFSDIVEKMDKIRNIEQLDINVCLEMCFRFSDFLDSVGITSIDFKKTHESELYNYT